MEKTPMLSNIYDLPELRDRTHVFYDRNHAGQILAGCLESHRKADSLILAIPAGGIPVGATVATRLKLGFDVAVVSKITLPWNTEAGYGAVAFDGTQQLNEDLLVHLGLTESQIQSGIQKTRAKVSRRTSRLRGAKPFPILSQKKVILIDDGLASGFTMQVAVAALGKSGAQNITVAVPTGHQTTVEQIAKIVNALYCPNIRSGRRFAVADAYKDWSDVKDEEVSQIMKKFGSCPD
jgi:putative phosphoribosyl transferase